LTSSFAVSRIARALARKNPIGRRISRSANKFAFESACASGYRSNSVGVMVFTRLSVVWADKITAMSS
jgi:hypothetical protein